MAIAVAIHGAAGRMGRCLISLIANQADLRLTAAVDAPGGANIGRDAGELAGVGRMGVALARTCESEFDVMIDFSLPAGTLSAIQMCVERKRAIVIGTTGHSAEQRGRIEAAAKSIAVLASPNMSVGVNVMLRLVRQMSATLGADYDVEIVEAHHRFKADAPSGTARALLDAVQKGRKEAGAVVHGREGLTGARPSGQIGVHAIRLGDTVGEHVVHFGTLGETMSIRHEAHSRETFASGALRAARWIVGRPAGLYSMQDVLFGGAAR